MWECRRCKIPVLAGLVAGALATTAYAQETGTVRGQVTFTTSGEPVHGAVVLVVGPSLVALTDANGVFEVPEVPAGTYEVLAQREHLTAARQTVTVQAGETVVVNFMLELTTIHEELTVTATAGGQTTAFEAFNVITTLDAFDLVTNAQGSLGEALENLPGVANRSFGPGASRPIIRGFDGDRVLLMEDGVRTGDLSSQSGDHGVTVDPNGLERIEVVRGPATLLYGSNAVGGVVNAVTPHESQRDSPISGTTATSAPTPGARTPRPAPMPTCCTPPAVCWFGRVAARDAPLTTRHQRARSRTRRHGCRTAVPVLATSATACSPAAVSRLRTAGSGFRSPASSRDGGRRNRAHQRKRCSSSLPRGARSAGCDAGMRNLTTSVIDEFRGHCQVDVEPAGSAPDEAMTHASAADTRHLSPDTERPCSQEPTMDGLQEMAADPKEILDGSMHREKPLRLGSRFEPAHLTLPLPGWLVGDFRPIVRVLEPERPTPQPNRLVRHGDTPFGEEIFDISETQDEAVVEPDGMTDDFRGKSVSAYGRLARHPTTLPPAAST